MKKLKNFSNKSCILVEIEYLKKIGENLIESALFLCNNDLNNCRNNRIHAFNLLISQSFEILPKSIIAMNIYLKKKSLSMDKIEGNIDKELKSLSHNLDKIFNKLPKLKSSLSISEIKKFKNDFVNEFRFVIKTNTNQKNQIKTIPIKHLEGIRYGSLSGQKNVIVCCNNDVMDLAKNLKNEVDKIFKKLKNKV